MNESFPGHRRIAGPIERGGHLAGHTDEVFEDPSGAKYLKRTKSVESGGHYSTESVHLELGHDFDPDEAKFATWGEPVPEYHLDASAIGFKDIGDAIAEDFLGDPDFQFAGLIQSKGMDGVRTEWAQFRPVGSTLDWMVAVEIPFFFRADPPAAIAVIRERLHPAVH